MSLQHAIVESKLEWGGYQDVQDKIGPKKCQVAQIGLQMNDTKTKYILNRQDENKRNWVDGKEI
jgi:hypothetical protein